MFQLVGGREHGSENNSPFGLRAKATRLKSQPTFPSSSRGLQTWNSSETQRRLSVACDVDSDEDEGIDDADVSDDDCVADDDDA